MVGFLFLPWEGRDGLGSFVVPAVVAGHLKAAADASRDSQAILGELLLRSTIARTGTRSATPRYGCRLPDRTNKRNTPGDTPGAPCRVVPVGVAMMAVAMAFFLRLLHALVAWSRRRRRPDARLRRQGQAEDHDHVRRLTVVSRQRGEDAKKAKP
jgi:hypothetical protein